MTEYQSARFANNRNQTKYFCQFKEWRCYNEGNNRKEIVLCQKIDIDGVLGVDFLY
jgi:hypothetical protein